MYPFTVDYMTIPSKQTSTQMYSASETHATIKTSSSDMDEILG